MEIEVELDHKFIFKLKFELPKGLPFSKIELIESNHLESSLRCKIIDKCKEVGLQEGFEITLAQSSIPAEDIKKWLEVNYKVDYIDLPNGTDYKIPIGLTIDDLNNKLPLYLDFNDKSVTQMYVVGTSGSGKSSWLEMLIIQLIKQNSPKKVNIIGVELTGNTFDPFYTNFTEYLPLLFRDKFLENNQKINTKDVENIAKLKEYIDEELIRRMDRCTKSSSRDIFEYNSNIKDPSEYTPQLFVIIDEYSDLIKKLDDNASFNFGSTTVNWAKTARKYGVRFIFASQESSDIDKGIVNNSSYTVIFKVASEIESQIVLDSSKARHVKLKGEGYLKSSNTNEIIHFRSPNYELKNYIKDLNNQKIIYDQK